MGTSASCQGGKAADIGETCSCKQTSGLTLYMQTSLARKILHAIMNCCIATIVLYMLHVMVSYSSLHS